MNKACTGGSAAVPCEGATSSAVCPPLPEAHEAPPQPREATQIPSGRLLARTLDLAWPAIVEQLLNMTVGLVNTYLVGHLGATALAAVGLGDQVVTLFSILFSSVAVGATAVVARHVGAEERHVADVVGSQSILLAVGMGAVSALAAGLLAGPLLRLLGAAPDVVAAGAVYLRIIAGTMLLMSVMFVGNAVLRGAGDTRTPMLVMLGVNGVNIVVAYALVNGVGGLPRLGVAGSAIGAATARGLGGVAVVAILLRRRAAVRLVPRYVARPVAHHLRRILAVGLPAGAEQLSLRIALLIFASLVTRLGTVAYAGHQVALMLMSLSYMPGWGFSVASTTLVGQALGAGRPDEAERSALLSTMMNVLVMAAIGFLLFLGARPAAAIFTNEPAIIQQAVLALRTFAFAQPFLGIGFVLAGALRGAGDTRSVLFLTSVPLWLVRLPLAYLLGMAMGLGLVGIWAAADADWLLRSGLLWWRFRRGRWKTLAV
ncbi:MAG: MATE family efflux transporter [Anaerolineae bacterium]|nr:MATE family efflux transporter [Anaerolineae bacterium]